MRTERPSCLILCFDWRTVYEKESRCCKCCRIAVSQCTDSSAYQPCFAEAHVCCTRDGCPRNRAGQEDLTSSGHTAAARTAVSSDLAHGGQSSSTGSASPSAGPPVTGSRVSGTHQETRTSVKPDDVESAEADAMATIEFFRERLQRRLVIPKMVRRVCIEKTHPLPGIIARAVPAVFGRYAVLPEFMR